MIRVAIAFTVTNAEFLFAAIVLHACIHWIQQQVVMTDVHTSIETYWFGVAQQSQVGTIQMETWIKLWPVMNLKI